MNRAYSALHVKEVSEDTEFVYIRGIASTPTVDRMGDIVDPLGAQFKTPMPLLWHHRPSEPVGQVTLAKPTKNGIPFEARLPIVKELGLLKDRIDEAIHSMRYQLVNFVSIGFTAVEGAVKILESGGYHFQKWNWMELSLVTIPAQPDAIITAVKSYEEGHDAYPLNPALVNLLKTYDTNLPAALGTSQIPVVKMLNHSGASDLTKTLPAPEGNTMNISDQLKQYKETRATMAAALISLMEKSGDAGETLDQAKGVEYEELEGKIKSVDIHIERLTRAEELNKKTATPIIDTSGMQQRAPAVAKVTEKLEKGIELTRYVMCLALAKGDTTRAFNIAKNACPQNERVVNALKFQAETGRSFETIMKANVNAGTTVDATWAAPLVDYQNFAGDFMEFLRPQTIIGQFGTGNVPSLNRIPFNVRISGQTSGGTGYWVGEGAPKPLTKFDFNATELRWSKVAAISVLTEELIRFSNPSAEALVRQGLADALRARLDIDFIDPSKAAVANVSPGSIINGIAPISSTGSDAEAIRRDLRALWAPFIAAFNPPTSAVYIMSQTTALALSLMVNTLGNAPEFPGITMNGGTLGGVPVIVSEYADNTAGSAGSIVILLNARDIFLADDGGFTIDASREASLQMDDAPTNNSATGTEASLVSMFQTNSVALRAERYINWARRRTSAVSWLDAVSWGQ